MNKKRAVVKITLPVLLLIFLSPLTLFGQSASPVKLPAGDGSVITPPAEKEHPLDLPRFDKPPVIDGRLDDEAWKQAVVFKDFYQIDPGDNIAPSVPTEALLGYDANFLYLAFRAHDEASKVRATVAKRDAIFDDDYVRVLLDTYNDRRKAYDLYFNPLGIQADAIFTETGGDDFSVDVVMSSQGVVTSEGYTVEVAIPFKSLRYEPGESRLWGIHLFRRVKRFNDELDSWMPISRDRTGMLNQAGHITGLEGLSNERTLEIIPSFTISETGRRVRALPRGLVEQDPTLLDSGRFLNEPIKPDPGVTLKLGITPNITLDAAINPDFAQVEADATVVTANQRFPIFFEEKRPFFLEGKDVFQTPLNALNTRAIVDPDYAVKLTGKRGRSSFGLLLASDNAPGNFSEDERTDPEILPDIQRFLDKNAYIGVVRVKHDIGKESNLGLIATSYSFIEDHNHVGGFDGRIRVNPQTVLDFQVLGTTSRRFFTDPDTGKDIYRTGNGFGYYFNYDSSGRHFGYTVNGEGRTPDYVADVGFTRRVNTNFEKLALRYNSEPDPKAMLISWHLTNSVNIYYDWQGRDQRWDEQPQIALNLRRQTTFSIGARYGYERLFEEEFGQRRGPTSAGTFFGADAERTTYKKSIFASGKTIPSKKYSASFYFSYDYGAFDFDFGAGPRYPRVSPAALDFGQDAPLDPGPGNLLDVEWSAVYQPTDALRLSLDYTRNKLTRTDTRRIAFDESIYALRGLYQFTRFTFARARVDYDSLGQNVLGQFLLGWTPNPGTSFYVGYNNDLFHNSFNPFTNQLEPGFRRNGQTFFIKVSYLFRRSL
jgi:hypothetical protein